MRKKDYSKLLLAAVTGASLIAMSPESEARQIDGVNKEIICKRPKVNERQLKLHNCATLQYPLAPLAPAAEPANNPAAPGPYSS